MTHSVQCCLLQHWESCNGTACQPRAKPLTGSWYLESKARLLHKPNSVVSIMLMEMGRSYREEGCLLRHSEDMALLSAFIPCDALMHTSQRTALRGKQPHLSASLLLSPDIFPRAPAGRERKLPPTTIVFVAVPTFLLNYILSSWRPPAPMRIGCWSHISRVYYPPGYL